MINEKIFEQQYFIAKENSEIARVIENYFKDKENVKKDLKDFADFLELDTKDILINVVGNFLFKPTELDKEKYKNKIRRIDTDLYRFKKNSKEYKEFKKRKEDGKFKLPYLALSEVLGIPSKGKYHLTTGDITGNVSQSHTKGQYLLCIKLSPQITHSDLMEIKASTYHELLRIAKEEAGVE